MALTRVFAALDRNQNGLLDRNDLATPPRLPTPDELEGITSEAECGTEIIGADNLEPFLTARGVSSARLQRAEQELFTIASTQPPSRSPVIRVLALLAIPFVAIGLVLLFLIAMVPIGAALPLFCSEHGPMTVLARALRECARLAFGPDDPDTRAERVTQQLRADVRRAGLSGLPCSFALAPAPAATPPPPQTCGVSLRPSPKRSAQ